MEPFRKLTSDLIPLSHDNVDTDQIIPARYLKVTDKSGLAFSDWRYHPDGSPDPQFALNRPECQGAQIILAGDNFGCGSSREHAPWALVDWGIRAVVSTSFADIFRNNALKNGLVPVVVDKTIHAELFELVIEDCDTQVTIDLEQKELVLPNGNCVQFPIDSFSRYCLLDGVDQLGYLLKQEEQITQYEKMQKMAWEK
jgi:3-isopropylmalate/(R)-2-methylmalate dehydratase small subunit